MRTVLVKTLCVVYGTKHKYQKQNFTKLPTGSIGELRHHTIVELYNIDFYLVRFAYNDGYVWANVAPGAVEQFEG